MFFEAFMLTQLYLLIIVKYHIYNNKLINEICRNRHEVYNDEEKISIAIENSCSKILIVEFYR